MTSYGVDICSNCWADGEDFCKCGDKTYAQQAADLRGKPLSELRQELDRSDNPHYTEGGIEVIDVIKAKHSSEQYIGFLSGNVTKYALRWQHKGRKSDLKKLIEYASWLMGEIDG